MSVFQALDINLLYCTTLNFAMEQNDVPFIRSLSIANAGAETVGACRVRITTTPEATLAALPPGETVELGVERINPRLLRDPLVRLEERAEVIDGMVLAVAAGQD